MLILHGDQYDAVTSNAKWISKFGGMLYDILMMINRPMSKYLKNLTKKIVSGASGFQKLVKEECLEGNYAGLMCGHNHRPEILKYNPTVMPRVREHTKNQIGPLVLPPQPLPP